MGRGIEEDTGTTRAEGVVPPPPRSPIKSKQKTNTSTSPTRWMRTSDRWIIIFITILSGSFSRSFLCFWAKDAKIIYAYARWYIKMALEQQEKS